MDQTSFEEVQSLSSVLSVTDVRTLDLNGLNDLVEDLGLANGTSWQTNKNDLTQGSDLLSGLSNSSLGDRDIDDTVWTTVSGSNDILNDILTLGEIDEDLSC